MQLLPTAASILHLDVDAFFASVEQRDDPRLRSRPVAVGTGVVASCSYEARLWGVRTAMRLTEARARCPRLIVLPGDYRRYEQAGRRILGISLEFTPRVEAAALDDLYLDLNQPNLPPPEVEKKCVGLAKRLREQIQEEVQLSVSMGIGTSKLLASVATDDAKRQRLALWRKEGTRPCSPIVLVSAGTEVSYLSRWPIETLPGIGPKTQARLERLNVRSVAELAAMPIDLLYRLFGERGRSLYQLARGLDRRPVEPYRPPRSISRRTSFEPPTGELEFLLAMLQHLLERAVSCLRVQNLGARVLVVHLYYGDYQSSAGRISFREAILDELTLQDAARERFLRLYTRRLPLRLLGIELTNLEPPVHQTQLFPDPKAERAHRLADCKDAIRQRFGFMALMKGSSLVIAQQVEHDRENFRLRTPCLTK